MRQPEHARHTPGPWHVEERFNERQVVVLARVKEHVSVVVAAGGMSSIEQHANARLIAAAPDLLAALKALRIDANRLCDRNEGGTYEADCRRAIALADAAIAKAEGR